MNDKVHILKQLCSHDLMPTFPFLSVLFIEPVLSLSWTPWLFLAPGLECPSGHSPHLPHEGMALWNYLESRKGRVWPLLGTAESPSVRYSPPVVHIYFWHLLEAGGIVSSVHVE